MKFTFKKHPRETGLRSVAHYWQDSDIKLKGKVVGVVSRESHLGSNDPKWRVRVQVKITPETVVAQPKFATDNDAKVGWKWVTFKAKFDSDELAKNWIEAGNVAEFLLNYKLELHASD